MTALQFDISLTRGPFSLEMALTLCGSGITALLGPSGCGKSTLLRALAGLENPYRGFIRLGSRVWFDSREGVFLRPQYRRAGFLFQQYALFPHMSVLDNICFGAPKGSMKEVSRLIEVFQIGDIAHCRPDQISGGQRQRVALARAIAMAPEVLLLDEPFSSVDTELRHHLRLLLREIASRTGIPVLMVTHDLEDVREVADWVGVMGTGCLRRFGKVTEVFADPREIDVARILGWRNLLPVTRWVDGEVHGPWGQISAGGVIYGHQKSWIAVSEDCFEIGGPLAATVIRVMNMRGYRTLHCRLTDGSWIQVNLPAHISTPGEGDKIGLRVSDFTDFPRDENRSPLKSLEPHWPSHENETGAATMGWR
jgi:molybdate transport system ATP-binding protein